jgi:hypothetical protein
MKKVFSFFLCLILVATATGQIAVYDASSLKKLAVGTRLLNGTDIFQLPESDEVFKILKYYVPPSDSNDTHKIQNDFAGNPFISWDLSLVSRGGGIQKGLNLVASSIGSLDVTNIANGIASLMAERAKQELTIAFFNRFKKFATTDCPEFQILFPKTSDNLINLLSYNYPQMLPALRNGFFEDLKQLTYNVEGVLELPRYQQLLKNFPEVRIAIRTLRIIGDLENGVSNIAQVIDSLCVIPELNGTEKNYIIENTGSLLKLSAIISNSLRADSNNKKDIWLTAKEIKNLITDNIVTQIYMGLVFQKIKSLGLQYYKSGDKSVPIADSIFAKQKNNIFLFQNKISAFINLGSKVSSTLADIREKRDSAKTLTDEDYYNYISVSIEAADYVFGIVNTLSPEFKAAGYLSIAKKSNSLYKDIYTRQYTQAMADALDVLQNVHDLIGKKTNNDQSTKDTLNKLLAFIEKVKPYALFIANIAEAKTSDDVKAALENAILPVGSSSIKKNTGFNVSIQSYLGAFGVTAKPTSSVSGTWSDKFGVTAPIGISVTPSFTSWQNAGSLSLFVPLFDIGAIVDYQLKKDSTVNSSGSSAGVVSKSYSVKLGQIVSPGVYLVYGFFGNVPLSLGFGAQYGPGLSKIDAGNNAVVTNPSWRWNFFLAVDLPFFNIVNKSRAK